MDAGEAADLRSAGAGGVGGIDAVDIEGDVDGFVAEGAKVALDDGQTFFVKFFGGDHFDFVFAGEFEIVFAVDLAAMTYLQDTTIY